MKAKYGNQIVDVWEIGQATPKPSWVEEAFQKNYMVWLDNHVRILMAHFSRNEYQVWSSWNSWRRIRWLWDVCSWLSR